MIRPTPAHQPSNPNRPEDQGTKRPNDSPFPQPARDLPAALHREGFNQPNHPPRPSPIDQQTRGLEDQKTRVQKDPMTVQSRNRPGIRCRLPSGRIQPTQLASSPIADRPGDQKTRGQQDPMTVLSRNRPGIRLPPSFRKDSINPTILLVHPRSTSRPGDQKTRGQKDLMTVPSHNRPGICRPPSIGKDSTNPITLLVHRRSTSRPEE